MRAFQRIFIIGCLTLVLGLFAFGSSGWAFGSELSKASMAGITGVTVRIEGNRVTELDQQGLTAGKLREDAESQLQAAGIPLLSELEFLETKERPMLTIKINALKHGEGYIFWVSTQLYQHVYLIKQGHDKTYPATTWSTPGTIGIFYDPEDLRDLVKEAVNGFISAYDTVHP